jgi:hypothetical protein
MHAQKILSYSASELFLKRPLFMRPFYHRRKGKWKRISSRCMLERRGGEAACSSKAGEKKIPPHTFNPKT